MSKNSGDLYEFGPFRLDPAQRLLLREEKAVPLQPKAFDTLLLLVRNSEKVVLKHEILNAVWADTFVEESNLTQNIFVLRKAMGEKDGERRYIITVPGRGYRFAETVRTLPHCEPRVAEPHLERQHQNPQLESMETPRVPSLGDPGLPGIETVLNPNPKEVSRIERRVPTALVSSRGRWWMAAAAIASVLAAVLVAEVIRHRRRAPQELTEQQLTANPLEDWVTGGAISPDGKYVAYHDQTGLYLRSIDSGETHPVTLPAELRTRIYELCWFPGGGKLLASVASSDGDDIWVITILGEADPHLLYRHGTEPAISPDGRMIAFTNDESGKTGQEVWVGRIDGETPWKLVDAGQLQSVFRPSWSPDGRWIAYARRWKTAQGPWKSAIEVRPASGGAAKNLVSEASLTSSNTMLSAGNDSFAETWSPDWRLVFSVATGPESLQTLLKYSLLKYSLWEVRVEPSTGEPGDKPRRITQWSEYAPTKLAITADGKRLSVVKTRDWSDVYFGELGPDGGSMKAPRRLTLDDRGSRPDIWTRDGQAILFESTRNGKLEILRQGPNDNIAEMVVAGPRDVHDVDISPDGDSLVYWESESTSVTGGKSADSVRLMCRAIGRPPEMVLELPRAELTDFDCSSNPKASSPCLLGQREGKDLVLYSLDLTRGKGTRLAKIEVTNPARHLGWDISPDGSRVALVDQDKYRGNIEVLTLSDGAWHEVSLKPEGEHLQSIGWAADGKGFFVTSQAPNSYNLLHVTLAGKVQPLLRTGRRQWFWGPRPSPNGKYLTFSAQTYDSNLWVIDNF
jgi:DNA-binding winged helix-turn-helix (wHTH) protein/Tol biopolymer transport system component